MISFCIPLLLQRPNDRRAVLLECVLQNVKDFAKEARDVEVMAASGFRRGLFSRAAARNEAARQTHGDVLIFLDADTLISPESIQVAVDLLSNCDAVLPYTDYYTLTRKATDRRLHGDVTDLEYEHHFPSEETPEPTVSNPVVRRSAFDLVGGYDERFIGWGEEDRAFVYALETLSGPLLRVPGPAYHLWHPAPESARFDQPFFAENRLLGNRYREAIGDTRAMRCLVDEHRAL